MVYVRLHALLRALWAYSIVFFFVIIIIIRRLLIATCYSGSCFIEILLKMI